MKKLLLSLKREVFYQSTLLPLLTPPPPRCKSIEKFNFKLIIKNRKKVVIKIRKKFTIFFIKKVIKI